MKYINQRDSLTGILRNQDVRLQYQERVVHRGTGAGGGPGGPVVSEVEVSTADPILLNPAAELWFDPDAPTDPYQSINEVWIGDMAPTDPNVELWYSPSATLP